MRSPNPGPIVITGVPPYIPLRILVDCIEIMLRKFGQNPKIVSGIWESVANERNPTLKKVRRLYEDHCNVIQRVSGNPVICIGGLGDLAVRFPEWEESLLWKKRWRARYRGVVMVGLPDGLALDSMEAAERAAEREQTIYDVWQPDHVFSLGSDTAEWIALQIYNDWGRPLNN